jgi:hypothetical protein
MIFREELSQQQQQLSDRLCDGRPLISTLQLSDRLCDGRPLISTLQQALSFTILLWRFK